MADDSLEDEDDSFSKNSGQNDDEKLLDFLNGLDLSQFFERFKASGINWENLTKLTENRMRDMGLALGPRRKIARQLEMIKNRHGEPAPLSVSVSKSSLSTPILERREGDLKAVSKPQASEIQKSASTGAIPESHIPSLPTKSLSAQLAKKTPPASPASPSGRKRLAPKSPKDKEDTEDEEEEEIEEEVEVEEEEEEEEEETKEEPNNETKPEKEVEPSREEQKKEEARTTEANGPPVVQRRKETCVNCETLNQQFQDAIMEHNQTKDENSKLHALLNDLKKTLEEANQKIEALERERKTQNQTILQQENKMKELQDEVSNLREQASKPAASSVVSVTTSLASSSSGSWITSSATSTSTSTTSISTNSLTPAKGSPQHFATVKAGSRKTTEPSSVLTSSASATSLTGSPNLNQSAQDKLTSMRERQAKNILESNAAAFPNVNPEDLAKIPTKLLLTLSSTQIQECLADKAKLNKIIAEMNSAPTNERQVDINKLRSMLQLTEDKEKEKEKEAEKEREKELEKEREREREREEAAEEERRKAAVPVEETEDQIKEKAQDWKKIAMELLQTEENYLENLYIMLNVFLRPLRQAEVLSEHQVQVIFSDFETWVPNHEKLTRIIRERVTPIKTKDTPSEDMMRLGDVLLNETKFLPNYSTFVNNFDSAVAMLNKCSAEIPAFAEFLKRCEAKPECKLQPLSSFLIMPVQRIPRYEMLAKSLLKKTPNKYTTERKSLEDAIKHIVDTLAFINEKKRVLDESNAVADALEKMFGKDKDLVTLYCPKKIIKSGPVRFIGDDAAEENDNIPKWLRKKESRKSSSQEVQVNHISYLFDKVLVICQNGPPPKDDPNPLHTLRIVKWETPSNILHLKPSSNGVGEPIIQFTTKMSVFFFIFEDIKERDKWIETLAKMDIKIASVTSTKKKEVKN